MPPPTAAELAARRGRLPSSRHVWNRPDLAGACSELRESFWWTFKCHEQKSLPVAAATRFTPATNWQCRAPLCYAFCPHELWRGTREAGMPDVSLVLAVHRERQYVVRTLESLAEAARYARATGITTELVAVLDRADAATTSALQRVDRDAFENVVVLHADNGSPGTTRNDGCKAASGTYIAIADADDLISYNYIEVMALKAAALGPMTILVPQFIFSFGDNYLVAEFFALRHITPLAMLMDHPYVSRVFFHRSLLGRQQNADLRLTTGYAYEDWHFNCNAMALGYTFDIAEETIVFYRQRGGSLQRHANALSVRQIEPSALFEPSCYRRVCGPWVRQLEQAGDWRSKVAPKGPAFVRGGVCRELVAAANALDPAILPERFESAPHHHYLDSDIVSGIAYHRLCEIIGDRQFDEVFLLPFLTAADADRYVIDVMNELTAQQPAVRILIVFGEPLERHAWLERLPPNCVHIDLCAIGSKLSAEARDLLCLKLLQSCAGQARLHLRSSVFAERFFTRFAPVLSVHRPVFYRFSDGRHTYGDFTLVKPSGFYFVTEHLETIDRIVCDNASIVMADQRRVGIMPEKWQVLYARMEVPALPPAPTTRMGQSILWVADLDPGNRPELLLRIAELLAVRMPQITIDVFGRATRGRSGVTGMRALRNVRYHGDFEEFAEADANRRLCLLCTSHFDGIPSVVLEAMAAGLPVIAPDVGGISEVVQDLHTGRLLICTGDDDADAETYAAAIEALHANPELHRRLRQQAWALVNERHAPPRYARRIGEIFDVMPTLSEEKFPILSGAA
jgi:glycosyltransferase involved in cell wall biosynthesis